MPPNGQWDPADLAVIPGGTKMGGSALVARDLLASVVAMQEACLRETGLTLRPTSAADGYRSKPVQHRTFMDRYRVQATGSGPYQDVRYYDYDGRGYKSRFVRVSSKGSAAVPGTSNHGNAEAVDWANMWGDLFAWMNRRAGDFGWQNPLWARDSNPRNGSREPWHWEPTSAAYAVNNWESMQGHPSLTTPTGSLPGDLTPKDGFDMAEVNEVVDALVKALRPVIKAEAASAATEVIDARQARDRKDMLDQAGTANREVIAEIRATPERVWSHRVPTGAAPLKGAAGQLLLDARRASTEGRNSATEAASNTRPATPVEDGA